MARIELSGSPKPSGTVGFMKGVGNQRQAGTATADDRKWLKDLNLVAKGELLAPPLSAREASMVLGRDPRPNNHSWTNRGT